MGMGRWSGIRLVVSALCRLNERCRWALSRAKFMKGTGKGGRGRRPCICILFIAVLPLGKPVAIWWARVCGFTHSEAAQVSSAKAVSLDGGPGGTPTLHRLLVIHPCSARPRGPEAGAWGPTPCRRQQAVCPRDDRHAFSLGQQVEPPSAANHPDMELHPPPPALHPPPCLLGYDSTCSRSDPDYLSLE